jgi:hypothetical protein
MNMVLQVGSTSTILQYTISTLMLMLLQYDYRTGDDGFHAHSLYTHYTPTMHSLMLMLLQYDYRTGDDGFHDAERMQVQYSIHYTQYTIH